MHPPFGGGIGEKQRGRVCVLLQPRLLQAKTQPIGRVNQAQQRLLPITNLLGQLSQFGLVALQRTVRLAQSLKPLPVQMGSFRSHASGWPYGRLSNQMIDHPIQKFPQHHAGG